MQFPEDDEMEPEVELNNIDREMSMMAERRNHVSRQIRKRQMDPKDAKMIELAQNAGHALGANEALYRRIKFLETRIEVRDEKLGVFNDILESRDNWKRRAEEAEAKLERIKKRRRSR